MLEQYIYRGKQKLRMGYTTGSCAAAAAKAAVKMLLSGRPVTEVSLPTPKGIGLRLDIQERQIGDDFACCAVQKDGGDDPDATNGVLIYARAERISGGIRICGGEGVGRVTRKGLDQPVGSAAINRVPRQMITDAVAEVCEEYDYREGIRITIYVPGGEALAKKTYNPRMGIEGGISIIGTTGIVEPMSNTAIIETVRTEERMRRAEGKKSLLLAVGNYSRRFLSEEMQDPAERQWPSLVKLGRLWRKGGLAEDCVICSNFIGEAIDAALEYGFEGALLVGHLGKLVKLGAGIMNTHSAQADGRMEMLVTCGLLAGADPAVLKRLTDCVTTDAALDLLQEAGALHPTAQVLMERIQYYLDGKVKGEMKIGAAVFSEKYGVIGITKTVPGLIDRFLEEYND